MTSRQPDKIDVHHHFVPDLYAKGMLVMKDKIHRDHDF